MHQPAAHVSEADVERILRRDFAGTAIDEARAILSQYGPGDWDREPHRVRAACLKLSWGDLRRLQIEVEAACADYRDVLSAGEYPSYARQISPNGAAPEVVKAVIESDLNQYQRWFTATSRAEAYNWATIKAQLRREMKQVLKVKPADPSSASRLASERLLSSDTYIRASSLLLYMPLRNELDVRLVLERALADQKSVALPRFDPDTATYNAFFVGEEPLVPGPFDILEPPNTNPAPLNRLDLIVVPGLAFDPRGRRLGRGKGFYDRLLSAASGVKCGICFDEQLLPEIPVEPHDVLLDFVATPTRWIDCRGSPTPETQ